MKLDDGQHERQHSKFPGLKSHSISPEDCGDERSVTSVRHKVQGGGVGGGAAPGSEKHPSTAVGAVMIT